MKNFSAHKYLFASPSFPYPSSSALSNAHCAPPPGSAASGIRGDRAGEEREAGDSPHANLHDCQLLSEPLTLPHTLCSPV